MKYRKGYKIQLADDWFYQTSFLPSSEIRSESGRISIDKNGRMTIREGYSSDGPSGPTYDRKENIYAGVGHDGLYQMMREGRLPHDEWKKADRHYGKWMKEKGAWDITVWVNLKGLAIANGKYARPENRKKLFEA